MISFMCIESGHLRVSIFDSYLHSQLLQELSTVTENRASYP